MKKHTAKGKTPAQQPNGVKLAYTAKELCALLSVSARSLYRLEKRELLKPCRALRTKLYPAQSVEAFLRNNS